MVHTHLPDLCYTSALPSAARDALIESLKVWALDNDSHVSAARVAVSDAKENVRSEVEAASASLTGQKEGPQTSVEGTAGAQVQAHANNDTARLVALASLASEAEREAMELTTSQVKVHALSLCEQGVGPGELGEAKLTHLVGNGVVTEVMAGMARSLDHSRVVVPVILGIMCPPKAPVQRTPQL